MSRLPTLTIGMAHFEDYNGVYFTIQSLRLHQDCADVEWLVVDNSPASAHGADVRNFLANVPDAKYVPYGDAVGTSAPRDRVFREATADVVLCLDCHVLLVPGAIAALRAWWAAQAADSRDMLAGPLLHDSGGLLGTQYNDMWRAEMWGIWGSAWRCPCDRLRVQQDVEPLTEPLTFTPFEQQDNGLIYRDQITQQPVTACPRCAGSLPAHGWAGHQHALERAGYQCLAYGDEPFEIPGMGLGLFSMRRQAWVGFHPQARGFGGEELYVHEKVRRAGGRVWCHPAVKWLHRWGRPGGVTYPIGRYSKVRNYVLEFQELDLPLDPIREHWVDTGLLPTRQWEHLLVNPGEHATPPANTGCGGAKPATPVHAGSALPQPPAGAHNLDTLFEWCAKQPRDLDRHAAKIRELASQASHVSAIVKRREWDVFLAAGRPDDLVTYTTEHDVLHDKLHATVLSTETNPSAMRRIKNYTTHQEHPRPDEPIAETDLLVIDAVHQEHQLYQQLMAWGGRVRGRILMRGTQNFGEIAEGGAGPGLLVALRRFMREQPQWSVIYHTTEQYGLTVISRLPNDKPKLPGVLTLAANFTKAVAEHVGDGLKHVTAEQLESRLQICTLCDQRRDTRCSVCGCFLQPKATIRSSLCPLGRWPDLLSDTSSPAGAAA